MEGETQLLRAVATDGHRLAQAQMPAPAGARRHAGRHRSAQDRVGSAETDRGSGRHHFAVELSETKIRLTIGPVVLTSKLIDGTFPDYEKVIPKGNDKILKCRERPLSRRPWIACGHRVERARSRGEIEP